MEARGGGEGPGVAAEGAAALEADLDALRFLFGERLIDVMGPVAGDWDWPGGEEILEFGIAGGADGEAGVGP